MAVILSFFIAAFALAGVVWAFVSTPAGNLANILKMLAPVALIALGGILAITGRAGIGLPMVFVGIGLWRRTRGPGSFGASKNGKKSTVRSAALEMQLDHDSGDMNGQVLTGSYEGRWLSELSDQELMLVLKEISSDQESVALFEAYLDRRTPSWRENTDANAHDRQAGPSSSGSMTKQEAYQILGLEPGASDSEIRQAWRHLMKGMHPDRGGSVFLAAKINEAKEVLLN